MKSNTDYKLFQMLQHEISFDVDVTNMPGGTDLAIYFSELDKIRDNGDTKMAGTVRN